ncbi:MAG: hypothetical protein Q8R18_04840 [bacterium]|nr:hypothetical protein [bacterium]
MKRILLFFLLLIPCTTALAVSPTSVDLRDGSIGEVYIYNTLETQIDIQIDGVYKENFTLAPEEKKILHISVQGERPGSYEGQLIIKEVYDNGFINAIAIPVEYAGVIPQTQKQIFPVKLAVSLLPIIGILIGFTAYLYKKRKKCV